MTLTPISFVVVAAMLIVVGVLIFGISAFAKGGEFGLKYSNKAMQWRLIAQFVAVLLIVAFSYFSA